MTTRELRSEVLRLLVPILARSRVNRCVIHRSPSFDIFLNGKGIATSLQYGVTAWRELDDSELRFWLTLLVNGEVEPDQPYSALELLAREAR